MNNTEDYVWLDKWIYIPKSFIKQLDTSNAQEDTQ